MLRNKSELRSLLVMALLAIATEAGCKRTTDPRSRKSVQVTGTVLEAVDGPPYTYLRMKTDTGEVWAMVPATSVGRNERVTVSQGVLLKDFDTGLPGRRFDVVMGALERR